MAIFGINTNIVSSSVVKAGPEVKVTVYTKEGLYKGHKLDKSVWELWVEITIISAGMDGSTSIPRKDEDTAMLLFIVSREKRSFNLAFDGMYLHCSCQEEGEEQKLYYINHDAILYGNGDTK